MVWYESAYFHIPLAGFKLQCSAINCDIDYKAGKESSCRATWCGAEHLQIGGNGVQRQFSQLGGHEHADSLKELLQPVRRDLLPLVALEEDAMHLRQPPAARRGGRAEGRAGGRAGGRANSHIKVLVLVHVAYLHTLTRYTSPNYVITRCSKQWC